MSALDDAMRQAGQMSHGNKPKAATADLSDEAVMQKLREKLAELRTCVAWATAMGITVRWGIQEKDSASHPDGGKSVSFAFPRITEAVRKL